MLQYFLKGGPVMWPILLCSVAALAITINKAVQYFLVRRDIARPLADMQSRGSRFLVPPGQCNFIAQDLADQLRGDPVRNTLNDLLAEFLRR